MAIRVRDSLGASESEAQPASKLLLIVRLFLASIGLSSCQRAQHKQEIREYVMHDALIDLLELHGERLEICITPPPTLMMTDQYI
jgi:hypothetical protein